MNIYTKSVIPHLIRVTATCLTHHSVYRYLRSYACRGSTPPDSRQRGPSTEAPNAPIDSPQDFLYALFMYDLIIVGGGAAGLFLAANIQNRKVLLLEKMKHLGKKILLSGGGMCNLTNRDDTAEFLGHFGSKSKANFLKPALKNLSTKDLQQWFEERDFPLVTREDGKVFPQSLKAQSLVDLLVKEARKNQVEIRMGQGVHSLKRQPKGFELATETETYTTAKVLIATGGKSFESTGSDGSGYLLAKALGHRIVEPTQALVSVIINDYGFSSLAGNSIKQSLVEFYRAGENKRYLSARGDLLFTHRGISGPVVLNNSREIRSNDLLMASLVPTENKEKTREDLQKSFTQDGNRAARTILKDWGVFSALSEWLLQNQNIPREKKCSQLTKKERKALIKDLMEFPFRVSRKGPFSSAMVTAGGIALDEVNRQTMESRLVPGLYFAGEVLDIDGDTGGYNLQAAFSTALLVKGGVEDQG